MTRWCLQLTSVSNEDRQWAHFDMLCDWCAAAPHTVMLTNTATGQVEMRLCTGCDAKMVAGELCDP